MSLWLWTDYSISCCYVVHCLGTENQQWKLLSSVTVHGSYPSLCILDVKGDGVSGYLSKSQIWETLQVDRYYADIGLICIICIMG